MSKLTLEEAIKHCEVVAEQEECFINYPHSDIVLGDLDIESRKHYVAEQKQLAEWLTELKELRNSLGAVKLSNMKEARELIRDYKAENITQKKLIAEYKRLLKAAVEDFAVYGALKDLSAEQRVQNPDWRRFNRVFDALSHQWRYADEALALIGGDGEQNG